MAYWNNITRSNFLIKLKSWEYWPFGVIQFPAMIYWLLLSIRERSLVFFSASNPGIPMGGMFGESKYEVLKQIPPQYIPGTIPVSAPTSAPDVLTKIRQAGMALPVILKPDIGERGYLVRRINNEIELRDYLTEIKGDFLVQELVQLPLEFGVFYMKMPGEIAGKVISVVGKEMLTVTGDGKSSLHQLILQNDRAKLQWKKLSKTYNGRLNEVVPQGEKVELVSIGNHAVGTKFLNANDLINDRLSETFDRISREIPGFYFGRYDLRCKSVEDLYRGNVKIMELNGCGAEPAHIYDPGFSLWQAMAVQVGHWNKIFRISRANKRKGVRYVTHKEAFQYYRRFKSAVR